MIRLMSMYPHIGTCTSQGFSYPVQHLVPLIIAIHINNKLPPKTYVVMSPTLSMLLDPVCTQLSVLNERLVSTHDH